MSSLSQTIEQNRVQKIPADLKGLVWKRRDFYCNNGPEIHRIKTAGAYWKLGGGEDLPVDFNVRDLVIVHGSLSCSTGNVTFLLQQDDLTVHFRISTVRHCTHMTLQLCLIPYSASYGILKDLAISPIVNIGKPELRKDWGLRRGLSVEQQLADRDATCVGLEACELTDKDIEKLKDFKKLQHLNLSYNRITDKGLANLSHMKNLKNLYLTENQSITDAGLKHLRTIAASSKIQMISLSRTNITFEGLKCLRECASGNINMEIHHSLVEVKEHTGIATPSETRKSTLIRQLHNRDKTLTELVMDHTEGDELSYGVEDVRQMTLALQYYGLHSATPLQRVNMTASFCLRSLDWDADRMGLENAVSKLWNAAAELPCVTDLRFHCPVGQLVSVPILQYLRGISIPENLRRLELNVGGNLMDYSMPLWAVERQIDEFVGTIGRAVNVEVLVLKWRLFTTDDDGVTEKVQETLSILTNTLSRFEHLTTLHLEPFVCVLLRKPFFTASCLRTICQMKNLQRLKLAGMQFTDEIAFVIADELVGNTSLKKVHFWVPGNNYKNCRKNDDFSVDGLRAIRSMMEHQVHITTLRVESIDEDEYDYWSSMCDFDLLGHGNEYSRTRTSVSRRDDDEVGKEEEGPGEMESFDMDQDEEGVEGDDEDANADNGSISDLSSVDEIQDDGTWIRESQRNRAEEEAAAKKHEMNVRKYLQAKINSFCRLNAAGRGLLLKDTNASSNKNKCVNLLVAVHNDLDALLWVLEQCPCLFYK